MPPQPETGWTPYPHEALRVRLLWRRRLLLLSIVVGAFLAWLTLFQVSTTEVETISVLSQDGSTVTVERPTRPQRGFEGPDATVTVSPGRTARTGPIQQEDPSQSTPPLPTAPARPGTSIPFLGLLLLFGPMFAVLWLGRKYAGSSPEINYGVYKGAMPLEMVTATYRHLVVTSKRVDRNPFGKEQADYLADAGVDGSGMPLGL